MDGIGRFPLSFLLPLWILGCFLSSSNAVPLSQESNEDFEYGDLVRAGFRGVAEGFVPTDPPLLKSRYRDLQEESAATDAPLLKSRYRDLQESAATDIPVVKSRYRDMEEQVAFVPEARPTKAMVWTSDGEVGYRRNIIKMIKSLVNLFITEIQDDQKWEYLRVLIIKVAEMFKKGLDLIGDMSVFE